jgi:glycosyltransferase involved in cell wall biosynthesis
VTHAGLLTFVVPGDLETRTGGYGYDRHIVAGLRDRGWSVDVRELDDSFPCPTSTARAAAARVFAAIPADTTVIVDGLALGALPAEVEREAARLRFVALVHHPLAAETGIDPNVAARLEASERRALAAVRSVVTTSRATAEALGGYGVAPDRIAVVEPGTDPAPLARGSHKPSALSPQPFAMIPQPFAMTPQPFELALLCVATLIPRKGHELLFRALASMPDRRWRLTCAGSVDRDPPTVARLRAQLHQEGLEDRVRLAGDLDAATLAAHYDCADLFVLPTLYEGYGMAVAEALARGLPVISTATGAIPEMVTDAAGFVLPPGDLDALTAVLTRVLGDAGLRERLARGARGVRDRLPRWEDAAAKMADVLDRTARR